MACESSEERDQWVSAIEPLVQKGLLATLVKKKDQSKRGTVVMSSGIDQKVSRATVNPEALVSH